jgi:hypothetical protein
MAIVGELSWPPFKVQGVPFMVTFGNVTDCSMEILYFRDKMGRYPNDLEELKGWLGITDSDDRRLKTYYDAWGRPLKYVVENPKLNVDKFDLYSVGRNGLDEYNKPGFGDDIHIQIDENLHIRKPPKMQ